MCILFYILIRFATILTGKREVTLLYVFLMLCNSQCFVALPYGAVGWSAWCVIVVFPDQTHLFFCMLSPLLHLSLLCTLSLSVTTTFTDLYAISFYCMLCLLSPLLQLSLLCKLSPLLQHSLICMLFRFTVCYVSSLRYYNLKIPVCSFRITVHRCVCSLCYYNLKISVCSFRFAIHCCIVEPPKAAHLNFAYNSL